MKNSKDQPKDYNDESPVPHCFPNSLSSPLSFVSLVFDFLFFFLSLFSLYCYHPFLVAM